MSRSDIYIASLCKNGILGGMLYAKENELVYCTNKLTVPKAMRELHLEYRAMERIEKAPFYTVLISMNNGERYRFLVFSRARFLESVRANRKQVF